jgi:hypothetical protein
MLRVSSSIVWYIVGSSPGWFKTMTSKLILGASVVKSMTKTSYIGYIVLVERHVYRWTVVV